MLWKMETAFQRNLLVFSLFVLLPCGESEEGCACVSALMVSLVWCLQAGSLLLADCTLWWSAGAAAPQEKHHSECCSERKKNPSVKELLASSKGQPGPPVSFVCMKFSPGNVIRISQFKGLGKSNYLWAILGAARCFCQTLDSCTV